MVEVNEILHLSRPICVVIGSDGVRMRDDAQRKVVPRPRNDVDEIGSSTWRALYCEGHEVPGGLNYVC